MRYAHDGYIALLAVLIVGAASLSIATTLLLTGSESQTATLATQQSIQARGISASCAEEALQVIHDNTAYTGTATVTIGQGNCTYVVTSTGASTRVIDVTATVNSVVRKTKVYVTRNASSITVTSWQDVT